MAVLNTDLQLRYTGTTGTAITSLGGAPSTTQVSTTTLHNIFDEVSGDESAAGELNYRILVFHNASSQQARNVKIHFEANYDSGNQSALTGITADLVGDTGIALLNGKAAGANPDVITNEDTAPSITGGYVVGTTRATGLDLGDIDGGSFRGFAIRRAITPGASAQDNAEFQLEITADTGE